MSDNGGFQCAAMDLQTALTSTQVRVLFGGGVWVVGGGGGGGGGGARVCVCVCEIEMNYTVIFNLDLANHNRLHPMFRVRKLCSK